MREGVGFFDKLFCNYAKPLLDSAKTQQLRYEQLGELPEHLKIEHMERKIEACIQSCIKKDPNDQMAFLKGLFQANKWKFIKFVIARFVL